MTTMYTNENQKMFSLPLVILILILSSMAASTDVLPTNGVFSLHIEVNRPNLIEEERKELFLARGIII